MFLILVWEHFLKTIRNDGLTKHQNPFIINQTAEWNLDDSFVASGDEDEVIIVELSLALKVRLLIE